VRFRNQQECSVEVVVKAWGFPGTREFIKISQVFDGGEVTSNFGPEDPMTQVFLAHPAFKPYEPPTIWERLITDP